MNKTIVIGIDSLDPNLLTRYQGVLPNMGLMKGNGPQLTMNSIFPPDTIPAWASIFLGENPARHGLLYTTDIFGSQEQEIRQIDMNAFRGRTFWDYASSCGRKVSVLFPNLVYPPWTVNGVMVCRSTVEIRNRSTPEWMSVRTIQSYPPDVASKCDIPGKIDCVSGYPPSKKDFKRYIETARRTTEIEAAIGLRVADEFEFDLFFIFLSWLDVIQHYFWRYCDPDDPTYPGTNEYQNSIREFYVLVDRILGEFLRRYAADTVLLLSDHGHGMRPTRTVNVNELLRNSRFLIPRRGGLSPAFTKAKKMGLDFATKHNLMRPLVMITRKLPMSKSIYMSSHSVDRYASQAYLSAFVGSKSYPQGGIILNRDAIQRSRASREKVSQKILSDLRSLQNPDTGELLVKWAQKRESIYEGPYIERFPDILFELRDGYGVFWAVGEGLIGVAYEHSLSSGGHTNEAALLIANPKKTIQTTHATLMDIAPTILDHLDVEYRHSFDGVSLFRGMTNDPKHPQS